MITTSKGALLVCIAKLPPSIKLLFVVGIAVLVTMLFTGKVTETKSVENEQKQCPVSAPTTK
jgi:hypothetical protein